MNIGYACKTIGVQDTKISGCTLKTATSEKLTDLIRQNLLALDNMLRYNHSNDIRMLRISSDLIPFATSAGKDIAWDSLFAQELSQLQKSIAEKRIRVSMHPGQYTVLNSPDRAVVERAVEDLVYHARVLDALAPLPENKIILHVGGVYGDKPAALARFAAAYKTLPANVQQRLVLENDERCYCAQDVFALCQELGIPAVFDNLHHQLNRDGDTRDAADWIRSYTSTWRPCDGRPKIHYAQQEAGKRAGSHAQTIAYAPFLDFVASLGGFDVDIMLEVKDKNLSALKCINCLHYPEHVTRMEREWGRYKYLVLEHSLDHYQAIRNDFREKRQPIAHLFYHHLETSQTVPLTTGHCVNALHHVWGYFKTCATDIEKDAWEKRLASYAQGSISLAATKAFLYKLAVQYRQEYLLQSLYFALDSR